jgi:malate dehydrogenase
LEENETMKISIIGAAGNVGSSAAFNIATHNITDELVMIGNHSLDKLAQYNFDLTTAVVGLDIQIRTGNYAEMLDSDIVLVATGSAEVVTSPRELLRPNLPLIRDLAEKIKEYCPRAVVITATNPVDPLNYAMFRFTGFDCRRLIGYSANDSLRFRLFLAQALGMKSSQVEGTVIGEHGSSKVHLFSSVRINGEPFEVNSDVKQTVLRKGAEVTPTLERLRTKTGRTSSWATSMGITAICRAISRNTGEMVPSSVVLDGEYGCRGISIGVPVLIGGDGVHEILEWDLEPEEQEELNRSIEILRPSMKYVDELIEGK